MMLPLPRVAIGGVQPGGSYRPILWALVDALRRQGLHIQPFFSAAFFSEHRTAAAFSGACPRYLDPWIMTPELCRELFIRGAGPADLAVIEGVFHDRATGCPAGRLETLCEWLDLPRLVVLDASRLGGSLPAPPAQIDGVLIDLVESRTELARLSTQIETHWGVPVLGALEPLPLARAELAGVRSGGRPSEELCHTLGNSFLRIGEPERLVEIASRRPVTWEHPHLFDNEPPLGDVVIALAYDDALNCYFPDMLELLELRGATIVDFSPLRDETLPEADVVLLGCGHPERFGPELAANECMRLALRNHLRNGGRIYSEGGGTAYLCQRMETATDSYRMVGILPATARLAETESPPRRIDLTINEPCWLGPPGTPIRGYLDGRWQLEPEGTLASCTADSAAPYSLVKACRAIGSRVHLNFAAQPHLLPTFFHYAPCESDIADPWRIS